MSSVTSSQAYRIVGGIVPHGLVERIRSGDVADKASLAPGSYHLAVGESVGDAANRAFSYLRGAYAGWREVQDRQPWGLTDTRAQFVRERWLLLLLRELGYGTIPATPSAVTLGEREYPVSHAWGDIPIHLLGPGVDLDRRNPRVAGAARAPQAMVQELLNRTDEHLWAIVSNGLRLRLLRDSTALAGAAYLEFDLEAIFDGELFADFLLLWQLAHVSRLEKRSGPDSLPGDCWLEAWRLEAVDAGARALEHLRDNVKNALLALGNGFIRHPGNGWLVQALRDGSLSDRDYHRGLLRLVYRLLFVFVAEDRDLLLDPNARPEARERYARFFGTARLRRLSRIRSGGPHGDLWEAQTLVLRALGGDGKSSGLGEPALALPGLGGLFDPDPRLAVPAGAPQLDLLLGAALANQDFLAAVRELGWHKTEGGRVQPVDYRNLGSEELGSVYESLLELVPRVDLATGEFRLDEVSGNERKLTGSYYTPTSLVTALLDTALDPLLERARKESVDPADAERKLLTITVCDPACGSGHFLVAAARRIAQHLAQVRSGEDAPAPPDVQHAMREVVNRCIYGVDVNDLAAELAKVSLWLEALEPGKALGFLDAHIKVGNSLLGTTPALLADGVPDAAFGVVLTGDDKAVAQMMRRSNAIERDVRESGQLAIGDEDLGLTTAQLAGRLREVRPESAETAEEARAVAAEYAEADQSAELRRARQIADAWCAAFVWPKTKDAPPPPKDGWLHDLASSDEPFTDATAEYVATLAKEYRFFHWHIEFPEIFASDGDTGPDGWSGGFSMLGGNPPWERVKLQEQEFFAARDPEITNAPNAAARKKLIKRLESDDPRLWEEFTAAKRKAEGESALVRASGRYPLAGRGDVNTYAVFAEGGRSFIAPDGRLGLILPTGIATDATTQYFFRDIVEKGSLASLYDFENRKLLFPAVDSRTKFCLLTLAGRGEREAAAEFAFFLHDVTDLDAPGKRFALTPEEITLLNPNTGTCPVFRTRRDAEITLGIYRRVPVLVREDDPNGNSWGVSFLRMFDMSNDSALFHTRQELEADGWTLHGNIFTRDDDRMLPLYQGMMATFFDHRAADVVRSATATRRQNQPRYLSDDEHDDPVRVALPMYWVSEYDLPAHLPPWLVGFSNVTSPTNERSFVAFPLPLSPVGHSVPLIISGSQQLLLAIVTSFCLDYVLRQKLGGVNLTYNYVQQLPIPPSSRLNEMPTWLAKGTLGEWITDRVSELTYCSWDMTGFVRAVGITGAPFRWDPERRALIRAELDAAMFHLYSLKRDEVDYVMDTFPIVKRKDEAAHGEYRTKRLILEIYDAMAEAIRTGVPYQSLLDPEPGNGPRHPESSRPDWADLYQ